MICWWIAIAIWCSAQTRPGDIITLTVTAAWSDAQGREYGAQAVRYLVIRSRVWDKQVYVCGGGVRRWRNLWAFPWEPDQVWRDPCIAGIRRRVVGEFGVILEGIQTNDGRMLVENELVDMEGEALNDRDNGVL